MNVGFMEKLIRVQKIISNSGFASRREVEKMIADGEVTINGRIAILGDKAKNTDAITVKGKLLSLEQSQKVYYVLNKPPKTVSTSKDQFNRRTVVDLVPNTYRVVPVGRLDYNTTGAILLTNDYELVNNLIHPKYQIKRVYRARLDNPLTLKEFQQLNSGVIVNGKISHQIVDQVENKSYMVTLHVGTYHHVKKLFEAVGRKVVNLKRISYANIDVAKMPEGYWRPLTLKELKDLKAIVREQIQKYNENNEE
ncbi:16S rRNA uridine-516 pseudouridylate synthase [Mycoplasmopsis californica HAZ160_1]|nr:16S rRNA uridine-516 pseudouridylate synthase [Mycoplasmopsis californica HAZ160_1]BBG42515.1 16S rRNA uridine-516 pseudouridylate synthase [Mycoplasmopsis californica]BBG43089.1 16S rRNA uridine-516 pseudouridylate synthase [Mycoplasmopsis californica]